MGRQVILYSVVLLVPLSPSNSSSYEQERRKTIAAVIYYKKLNTLSALINIYLNFKTSTYSSQTIPFQFFYFLSRLNWVGPTSAKSLGSVWCPVWDCKHTKALLSPALSRIRFVCTSRVQRCTNTCLCVSTLK